LRRTEKKVPSLPKPGTFCVQSSDRGGAAGAASDFRVQGRKRKRLEDAASFGEAKRFPDSHSPVEVQPGREPLTAATAVIIIRKEGVNCLICNFIQIFLTHT
jgi:hypothetical protein